MIYLYETIAARKGEKVKQYDWSLRARLKVGEPSTLQSKAI